MKRTLIMTAFCTAAAAVMVSSCSKEHEDSGKNIGVRMTVSIEKYYNPLGALSIKTWEQNDKIAITDADSPAPETVYASPVSTGYQSSMFAFSLKNPQDSDRLLAWYPSSQETVYEGGKLKTMLPHEQNGGTTPFYTGSTSFSASYSGLSMTLNPLWCTLYANVTAGEYSIISATLAGKGGEKIAGETAVSPEDMSATASLSSVTVRFAAPLDCSKGAKFPFSVVPGVFENGYTIEYVTSDGERFSFSTDERVVLEAGGKVDSDGASDGSSPEVLICGDNMIYHINTDIAAQQGYRNAILWEWDARTIASQAGKDAADMIRLDDCKIVDEGTKILASSSKDWAALIDRQTKQLLWYSTCSDNAHSAELLPDSRVAIACSDGGDCLQIFDIASPNVVKFSTPLSSAHGVVWNPANERLYAIGGTTLNVYTLEDWDTSAPSLKLERSISTSSYVKGLHDMTLVDDNTLLVAGNKAAFYNIKEDRFTNITHFSGSTALKSVNYNPYTGECWYTDATGSQRELSWSSDDIRYTSDTDKAGGAALIRIGDINMYKVRVAKW